jgi:hypothetical protein
MPRAEIASKQAVYTLGLLHAEWAACDPDDGAGDCRALLADKAPQATHKQAKDLQAACRTAETQWGDGGWRWRTSPMALEK